MKRFLAKPVLVVMAVVALAIVAWANRPRVLVCTDCNPVPNSLPNDILGRRPERSPDTLKGTLR